MNDKFLKYGEPMEIELEAVIDSASFCEDAMEGKKEREYKMKFASLAAIDEVCEKYYLNCALTWDALPLIKDEYIREAVYKVFDDSLHMVDFDFDDAEVRQSIYEACEYFDAELSKIPHTPQFEVIMDGHSHLDIAWLWRVQETERKTSRTFANNLALMDHYPEFKFTQSQAIVYHWIKNNNPELYERIKEKVKNGQWNIVGNTWVECDTNIASGESMIRQLLYGRAYYLEKFGRCSDIFLMPDSFGYSGALPQIMAKSGVKYFLTIKMSWNAVNLFPHSTFNWIGLDGSTILTHMPPEGNYNSAARAESMITTEEKFREREIDNRSMLLYGIGDGGGGPGMEHLERLEREYDLIGIPKVK